jgi:hypothetical protein
MTGGGFISEMQSPFLCKGISSVNHWNTKLETQWMVVTRHKKSFRTTTKKNMGNY